MCVLLQRCVCVTTMLYVCYKVVCVSPQWRVSVTATGCVCYCNDMCVLLQCYLCYYSVTCALPQCGVLQRCVLPQWCVCYHTDMCVITTVCVCHHSYVSVTATLCVTAMICVLPQWYVCYYSVMCVLPQCVCYCNVKPGVGGGGVRCDLAQF